MLGRPAKLAGDASQENLTSASQDQRESVVLRANRPSELRALFWLL